MKSSGYTAAEVMGNLLNALAWLANHLETRGLALNPGDVVMSGAISKMLCPKANGTSPPPQTGPQLITVCVELT